MFVVKTWLPSLAEFNLKNVEIGESDSPSMLKIKKLVSEFIGNKISEDQIELFYLGKRINDDNELATISGTIYAMRNPKDKKPVTEPSVSQNLLSEVDSIVTSIQTSLVDPPGRELLMRLTSSQQLMGNLITTVPGMVTDHTVQKIIADPFLLLNWLTSKNMPKILNDHPALIPACQQLMAAFHAEFSLRIPVAPFIPDDDSSMDEEEVPAGPAQVPPAQQQQVLDQQQFQHALAGAFAAAGLGVAQQRNQGGDVRPGGLTGVWPPAPPPQQQQQQQQPLLNANSFQQALAAAMGGANQQRAPSAAAAPPPRPQISFEGPLSELRAMGFTDERENMVALTASGGDLDGALEYIISKREAEETQNDNMGLD